MKNSERLAQELAQVQQEHSIIAKALYNPETEISDDIRADLEKTSFTLYKREQALKDEIRVAKNHELEVGDGCTVKYYTDAHAATVIKKTKTTITVQRDKATLSPDFKPEFIIGGFCAHCTNQSEQTYTYERDEEGETFIGRWSDKYGCYKTSQGLKIYPGRREFYDYNF